MAKKDFKAESKRLLDLMINSIYTHKDIFLRELISNANDALDKLHFISLTNDKISVAREDLKIKIEIDKAARELKISDNGIGMTAEELESNLGTIAKSGSLAFKEQNKDAKDIDVIGQFGVGFYAAFMVSDEVSVISRSVNSDKAHVWTSSGAEGYDIAECEKATNGTEITLKIKPSSDDEDYDKYLNDWEIKQIVKKYSDYIRYPIMMDVTKSKPKEGSDKEYEEYTECETLNSMIPIWKKNKDQISKEEYDSFYKDKFYDYQDPLKVIHTKNEGLVMYNALLFFPSAPPYNFYTKEYEKGLQLYSNGVLIMEKCADLLPDYFVFVRGIIDSQDLSLNISREMLQHDRQLKTIANGIEKKIKTELSAMQSGDRENYDKLFENFGLAIKFGVYNNFGAKKELLQDLVMFKSSYEEKYSSLAEYVSRMKEGQDKIYYACGEDIAKIKRMPQTELVLDKGYEILYFTENVDEFAIKIINKFQEKEFISVSSENLDLRTDEEKEESKKKTEENKSMFDCMTEALSGKVEKVILSNKLKSHAVTLSSEGELSLEMEKVLKSMPGANADMIKAKRVLEVNGNHKIFKVLVDMYSTDKEKLKKLTRVLYGQSLLSEGLMVEDSVEFNNDIYDLMV